MRYVWKVCVGCLLFAILIFCASQKTNGSSLLYAPIGKYMPQMLLINGDNYQPLSNNSPYYDSGSGSSNNEGVLAIASDPGNSVLARFEDLLINYRSESNSPRLSPLVLALPPPPVVTAVASSGNWTTDQPGWVDLFHQLRMTLLFLVGAIVHIGADVDCASLTIQSGGTVIFDNEVPCQ